MLLQLLMDGHIRVTIAVFCEGKLAAGSHMPQAAARPDISIDPLSGLAGASLITKEWMQVEKLLEQYDNIAVALPEARALQEKHAAAAAWAAQAQRALDRPQPFRDEDAARLQVWCSARE